VLNVFAISLASFSVASQNEMGRPAQNSRTMKSVVYSNKKYEILRHFAGGFFLSFVSYALTMGAVALVCRQALHFTWVPALLVGAVLGCISSSIILPVLQQVQLRREVCVTLLVEAALGMRLPFWR
jgi:hypothetical protein